MSDETESFHHPIILYDWEELGEEGPLLGPPKEITENVYNTMRKQCIVKTQYMLFNLKLYRLNKSTG